MLTLFAEAAQAAPVAKEWWQSGAMGYMLDGGPWDDAEMYGLYIN